MDKIRRKINNRRKNSGRISLDEEFMMCAAYRYCIGRMSIASQHQAGYIASKYYDKLSDERLLFTAKDIRSEISDSLRLGNFSFTYDGTVNYEKRLPFEDFVEFLSTLKDPEKDLLALEKVVVYCESYKPEAEKKFKIITKEPDVRKLFYQHEIEPFLGWQRLAALFDKKHYKKLKLSINGVESEAICIETYVKETVEIPETPGYYKIVPWKYKKVYMNVNQLVTGNFDYCGYYIEDYITSVEDYDATQNNEEENV